MADMHPALLPFLDGIDKLHTTLEWKLYDAREDRFDGVQYSERELDADGYRPSGMYGSASRTPSWKERRISAVWNIDAEISEKLTDWTLGGANWCHLDVPGDQLAEDFLETVAEQAGMADAIEEARTYGGAMFASGVSFMIHEGEFIIETHRPKGVRVLEWRDPIRHRPMAVVKVAKGDNPDARAPGDYPWTARYWDESVEANLLRVRDREGRWTWVVTSSVTHGLAFCPFYWAPNRSTNGSHRGELDAPNTEGLVDEANELYTAAGCTTKRNADDTLVIRTDPNNNPGKPIRKGGFNAIFAEGGAEYLSQKGESATVCVQIAKQRADQAFRRACVLQDEGQVTATSGEERKMRLAATVTRAAKLRRSYARNLIVPLCQGILEAARRVGPAALRIPPRFDLEGKPIPRGPGTSSFVRCAWPTQFPPTAADGKMLVETAVAATGGKQVLSQRTAVKMLAANSAIPVENVDEELDAIEGDTEKAAKTSAAALGLVEDVAGAAGPVETEVGAPEADGKASR